MSLVLPFKTISPPPDIHGMVRLPFLATRKPGLDMDVGAGPEHIHRLVRSPSATCRPQSHDSTSSWSLCILIGWLGRATCKPMLHVSLSTLFLCIPIGQFGHRWQLVNQCVTIQRPLGEKSFVRGMPGRKRPRNTVAGRMVRGTAVGALPQFGGHNVPEKPELISRQWVQRNKGNASDLEAQLASGASRAEALTAYEHDKHAVRCLLLGRGLCARGWDPLPPSDPLHRSTSLLWAQL